MLFDNDMNISKELTLATKKIPKFDYDKYMGSLYSLAIHHSQQINDPKYALKFFEYTLQQDLASSRPFSEFLSVILFKKACQIFSFDYIQKTISSTLNEIIELNSFLEYDQNKLPPGKYIYLYFFFFYIFF